jgi:DNA glycosylase AlkZ-like
VVRTDIAAVASATWSQVAAMRLARQHLVERLTADRLLDVVREHVGIQAQVMSLAELQLNARLDGLRRDDVRDALWSTRTLVKTWAMRGTLHLIASDDLANFVAAAPTRGQWGGPAWLKYFDVSAEELDTIFSTVEESLTAEPMTRIELVEAVSEATGRLELAAKLQSGWGSFLKPASHAGALVFGPDRGRNVTFVDPEDWLGRPIRRGSDAEQPRRALGRLVERFLRLFPGADRPGVGRWWGARATMRPVINELDVVSVEIEGAKGLVLAEDAAALGATDPFEGVRLLPGFDAYVNDLPRRVDALLPIERHNDVHRVAGWVSPVVIVDGRVAGTWELDARNGIAVQPFASWAAAVDRGIRDEADRLAAFLDRPLRVDVARALPVTGV